MPRLARPGAELHYERHGSGDPVVLLNGIMMTTSSWPHQVEALSRDHEVILHDFRGQLRSPVAGPIRLDEHVADLLALLDHLELEQVVLAGTSYGGEVGMLFAVAHPERVRGLVVVACTSHVDDAMRASVEAWARAARERPHELYDTSVPEIFAPEWLRGHGDVVAAARDRVARQPPTFFSGLAELMKAFATLDVTARLHEIRCPTLVVAPELDVLKPVAVSRRIAEGVRCGELAVVEGAGHAVVIEQPERITAEIGGFLARLAV
jgi:3-oxoadipate enol-lactonase